MLRTEFESTDIRTPRLRLRRYLAEDLPAFRDLMGDVDVNRYVDGGHMNAAEADELFQKIFAVYAGRRFGVWAVEDGVSGEYTGHAELKPRRGEAGLELVYLLQRSAWGRGLGTELAGALRDHALIDLGASAVLATIHPENAASRRVLLKLGFEFVREWTEPEDDVATFLWRVDART